MMRTVGFADSLMWGPVGSLSGGWRMRLVLSLAMLKEPEPLLLDESQPYGGLNTEALCAQTIRCSQH